MNKKINTSWEQLIETPYHVLRVLRKKISDEIKEDLKNKVDYDVAILKASKQNGGICPLLTNKR